MTKKNGRRPWKMKLDHYTRKKLGFWWRDQKIRNFFIVSGFIIIIIK